MCYMSMPIVKSVFATFVTNVCDSPIILYLKI